MKAIVLCAGLGTRLRPLTNHWPKPAIPLLGQPLLRYALAKLRRAGIVEVGINTHHLPAVMRAVATAECERLNMTLAVSHEPIIQGTAGGVRGLKEFLGDEPFVVLNGDMLSGVDLDAVIAAHAESHAAATLVLMTMPPGGGYAPVEQRPDGRIVRIAGEGRAEPGTTDWHFTGIHVVNPEVFDFIAPSGEVDINRRVYPEMIARGLTVKGYLSDAYWADIGNPSGYLGAQRDLLQGRFAVEHLGSSSPFFGMNRSGINWIHATAEVDSPQIVGPAFFDAGCRVDRGARIGETVYIGRDAQVEGSSRLEMAAILEGTRIQSFEEIRRTIAWGSQRLMVP